MQSTQKRANNFLDLTGQKFNRLLVLSLSDLRDSCGKLTWYCQCDCGQSCRVSGSCLRRGQTQSCGCLMLQRTKEVNTKHGMRGSRTYRIWSGMLNRCRNANAKDFPNYGGRGIAVCERWLVFQNFLEDMGVAPHRLTIERKDNNLGYSHRNCVWASPVEQANNRRSSVKVEFLGQSLTAAQWEGRLGLRPGVVSRRHKKGWTAHECLCGRSPQTSP